jgi:predicted Zn-dependent peptidase
MIGKTCLRSYGYLILVYTVLIARSAPAPANEPIATARVPVQELVLENGMRFLLVNRPEATTVAAGWVVEVGSADETAGRTGLSHLLEHMMFKGSRLVGSRDIEKERRALATVDALQGEIRSLSHRLDQAAGKRRVKLKSRLATLQRELEAAHEEARSLAFLGQYSYLYSQLGAVGLNAHTMRDLTFYYVTLPSEKLEAWFWLESDRLLEPVFREFYKEIRVAQEERRLRIESTPAGSLDEDLATRFWKDHPYAWDPQGNPEDLAELTRADARTFFERHYVPPRLTAALVGRFDPAQAQEWARKYFGRLASAQAPEARRVTPKPRQAEDRYTATCNCPPQAQVLYPSVPFGHPDSDALSVMAALLNGRSGRLFRRLVLGREIAFAAHAQQRPLKQAGFFAFRAETKSGADPQELVEAWDEELGKLLEEPLADGELTRAKNLLTADALRRLKEPVALLRQLLIYQGLGDWQRINDWPRNILSVSEAEVRAATERYLRPSQRTIALYYRAPGTGHEGAAP